MSSPYDNMQGGRPAGQPRPSGPPPGGRPPGYSQPNAQPGYPQARPNQAPGYPQGAPPRPNQAAGYPPPNQGQVNYAARGQAPRPAAQRPPAQRPPAQRPAAPRTASGSGNGPGGRPPAGPPPKGRGGSSGGQPPKPPKKSSSKRWKIIRRTVISLVALGLVVPLLTFMVAYTGADVPKPGDIKTNQVATIYNSDGTSVISTIVPPEGNRTDVTIDQIPPHVRNAVLSAEDRDFYTNPGFSVSGFARAARDNVLGREDAGGGSTITQQYVKNALVGDERALTRKMRELVISSKMARQWSKDDILVAYLNTIYFGRGAYGIAAASKAYFNKPVEELTVEEGAVLAASIQLPSLLDPETNPTGAESRWGYVLDGMVSANTLSAGERAGAKYPHTISQSEVDNGVSAKGPDGLIRSQVIKELAANGINEQVLNTEGLQITTTIDQQAQQAAVDAVNNNMEGEKPELRTAVVSVDPKTGGVKAYYGGADGAGFDFAQSGLQTGSSFKVFGLAAALDQGIPLSKMYDSGPLTIGGITITNVEGESCGTCTIAEALKRSLNTSFYRQMMSIENGPEKIADIAHKAGIPEEIPDVKGITLQEPNGSSEYGIVLGQYQSRVIDMASAYATLAASGVYRAPHFVQKVVTGDGTVLLDRGPAPAGEARLKPAVADNVTSAMQPIAGYSRNHGLAGGRPSAAKTGTAQLGDTGQNKDAWMVGYTPSLATAVWVGTEQGLPLQNSYGGLMYGSGLPSDIWKATMDGALKGTDVETFPKPEAIAGQAGVPAYTAPYVPPKTTAVTPSPTPAPGLTLPPVIITPRQVEVLPGVTIPLPGLAPRPTTPPATVDPGPSPGQPTQDEVEAEDGLSPGANAQGGSPQGAPIRPNR
ncbi:membrane peptidoglycan carboxypeptidase [Rhodococcus sp. PvR044]|nr:peptidoglycan glycosyltransferase [Rhodococcus sp. OK611]SNX90145.1 peptidoglycan glycosyltransferase [Rhodococcus sp. OK270]